MPEQETLVHHPELLEPLRLPKMEPGPQVIITMAEYKCYEAFRTRVDCLERVIDRAKLEGRLEGLRLVRDQLNVAQAGQPILRGPLMGDALTRQIQHLESNLRELEATDDPTQAPDPFMRRA